MLWNLQYVYYTMLYENLKLDLAKGNPYISNWKLSNSMLNSIYPYWS